MKRNPANIAILASVLAILLSLVAAEEALATQFRTRRNPYFTPVWTWSDPTAWEYFNTWYWQWRPIDWMCYSFPPSSGDEVIIQSCIEIPAGMTVSVGVLRVGCNDIPPSNAYGWCYYPYFRHQLRVRGHLAVSRSVYVWDDTLDIDGGTLTNSGVLYVGNHAGYSQPSVPTALEACRACAPRLVLRGGGTIRCLYSSAVNSPYSGGLVFWPGSIEQLTSGTVRLDGWLIGADDTNTVYPPLVRRFDLTDPPGSAPVVILEGDRYPSGGLAPTVYLQDTNFLTSPENMRFHTLRIDRAYPGETAVDLVSHVEIHGDFELNRGTLQASVPRMLYFEGSAPARWTTGSSGVYVGILPGLDGKEAPLTLASQGLVPGFTLANPHPSFELIVDGAGARTESLTVLGGRVVTGEGLLTVTGFFRIGSSSAPLPSGGIPSLDLTGAGGVSVHGGSGGPNDGDFIFEEGATGSFTAGVIRAEGDFFVDNATFEASGTHTVAMFGNAGRPGRLGNLKTPPGRTVPTLLLQNLLVDKTDPVPGNEVDVFSEIEIRGILTEAAGVLDWNAESVGSLAFTPLLGNADPRTAAPGTRNLCVAQWRVAPDPMEDVHVYTVRVAGTGAGDEQVDVAGLALYRDANGNGVFEPATDILLAGPSFFTGDEGSCTLQVARTLRAGCPENWFLVTAFYETAPDGADFRFGLPSPNDVLAVGLSSQRSIGVTGLPLWGGRTTLFEAPAPEPVYGTGCSPGAAPAGPGSLAGWILLLATALLTLRSGRTARTGPSTIRIRRSGS